MSTPIRTKVILPPGSDAARGPCWTDLWIREGTSDEDVLNEVWVLDTYHLRGLVLGAPDHERPPPRIVDVGASTGIFTALCLQMFPDALVCSIEPDGDNLDLLFLNTVNWRHRCEIIRGAVGAASGSTYLVGGHATGHTDPAGAGGGSQKVALFPLAEFLDRPTALLKLDCEGAEYDAIAACPEAALANADQIVMEWHGTDEAPWVKDAPRRYGEMLAKLAYTHTVQTFGSPARGGYLFASRYDR